MFLRVLFFQRDVKNNNFLSISFKLVLTFSCHLIDWLRKRNKMSLSPAVLLVSRTQQSRGQKALVRCLETELQWRMEPCQSIKWQKTTVGSMSVKQKMFWDMPLAQFNSWCSLLCGSKFVLLKKLLPWLASMSTCRVWRRVIWDQQWLGKKIGNLHFLLPRIFSQMVHCFSEI